MANWCSCTIVFDDPPVEIGTRLTQLIQESADMELSQTWLVEIDSTDTEMWFSTKWGLNDQDVLDLGNKLDLGSFVCTYEEGGMQLGGKYTYHSDEDTIDHEEVLSLYWEDRNIADEEGWEIDMEDYFHVYAIWATKLSHLMYDIRLAGSSEIVHALGLVSRELRKNIK